MYSEKVMDHFSNPRNVGEIENADGVGTVGNAKCGDIMRIYLKVDENSVITDCKFKTFGCGAAIATSSMATEMVKGKTLKEALALTNAAVAEALDGQNALLPAGRRGCQGGCRGLYEKASRGRHLMTFSGDPFLEEIYAGYPW